MKMKTLKRSVTLLITLILLSAAGFWAWATFGAQKAEVLAQAALVSDGAVTVTVEDGFAMQPASPSSTGFIFYSGGLVTPEAYAAHLRPIAEAGHPVFAPKMPLNLAVFNLNAAEEIIAAHPEITDWVIGGHSLGGAMAAQYALAHDDEIDGLVLWASFPADGADLSGHQIKAVSVFGSNDGLALPSEIRESAARLPSDTNFAEIEGGNHAQFGDYGTQSGDSPAEILLTEQIQLTADYTLDLISIVADTP